jgi:putative selenate reductase
MSDKFSPVGISKLFQTIQTNEKEGHIFGIPSELFFKPGNKDRFVMERHGNKLENPIGVAAGPHSQMAQNIISAWLCGARYLELKTIQTLDELDVSKPCIDMQDEGYNCEWSQELKIHESFDEYLNAWVIIHVLKHKFGHDLSSTGMLFNMSVGYNMEGILKENVQWFFEKMKNCKTEKEQKIEELAKFYPQIREINIPDCISDNITLSTMHGCPPEEIEKIGLYLIREKKLNTTIKLNPTLLGAEKLRKILNATLGFKTNVPDMAFEHDLKYPDALKIIASLEKAAKENNVFFGIKLTNTLESVNIKTIFPAKEQMMYMSGRALHPISINLAHKIRTDLGNSIEITFSAGADCFNITDILSCDLKPVTVCSDILKPGGYGRLLQYLENIEDEMKLLDCNSLETLAMKMAGISQFEEAVLKNTTNYASVVLDEPAFQKNPFFEPNIKTRKALKTFDCIHAPCVDTCPTNQDIPDYLYHTANKNFDKAFETILLKNPFPNVLGMACDHLCQTKCTRTNYDSSILIREVKRFISETAGNTDISKNISENGLKAAIIGGGPSGLSCAYYLRLAGFEVNVYETKDLAGGMVADAIPSFRLSETSIRKDIDRIVSLGVKVHYNSPVGKDLFDKLRKENNFIYLAIGAQTAKKLNIENENSAGVIDSLKFLSAIRRGAEFRIGKNITVVGGGNTAMDVARTALRLAGENGKVTVVYRRTRSEMPADADEIKDLLHEGIEIKELTAPEKVITENGKVIGLLCSQMKLGEPDSSGRARPVKIEGSEFVFECDTIIPALGQDRIAAFASDAELEADPLTGKTKIANVYIGGDARNGAATIVKAVGDGRKTAESIIKSAIDKYGIPSGHTPKNMTYSELMVKKSKRVRGIEAEELSIKERISFNLVNRSLTEEQAVQEASRCLYCDELCSICVTVCPNRANITYQIKPEEIHVKKAVKNGDDVTISHSATISLQQKFQVLNVGNFCNECGNCSTFCPTSGAPFRDKPRFMLTSESFKMEENAYYFETPQKLLKKTGSEISSLEFNGSQFLYETLDVSAVFEKENFRLIRAELKGTNEAEFNNAAEMYVFLNATGLDSLKQ